MSIITRESNLNSFFSNLSIKPFQWLIVSSLFMPFIIGLTFQANHRASPDLPFFETSSTSNNHYFLLNSETLPSPTYSKITASDGDIDDRFGGAIAVDGNVLVVGAPFDNEKGTDAGAVYVFYRSGSNWIEVQKLTASDGASEDRFGHSVAISGKTIVVGAYLDNDKGSNSGSAYVFQNNRTSWVQITKLTASDGDISDRFGWAVDVSGDTVVVGAYQDDDACPSDQACNSGAVYIFEKNQGGANQWGQLTKLLASDTLEGDRFGRALAIDIDTLVIGAQACDECIGGSDNVLGKTYIFERNQGGANTWGESKILMASDAALGDDFSQSLDVSGNTMVIGAPSNDDFGDQSGSAYIFIRDWGGVNNWGEVKKITPADGQGGDNFGRDVAIRGDNVVIGAYWDDDAGVDSGSVYLFGRHIGGTDNWGQAQKIVSPDGSAGDYFGANVAISSNNVAIGAPYNDENTTDAGAAYIYPTGIRP